MKLWKLGVKRGSKKKKISSCRIWELQLGCLSFIPTLEEAKAAISKAREGLHGEYARVTY